ncbi:MAG TPA: hypothetical protein VJ301_07045, partial [Propionibacteriaceae bacterium]|nr:hypothetical protein [Propionibacteriaceae bacterium]
MSPHLVTAPVDEAYRPPESQLGDGYPSTLTGLTAQQASDLVTGHHRGVRRSQSWYWDRRLQTRLAQRQAQRRYWAAATERSGVAVERARSALAATSAMRRPYGRIGAFLITALLMLASFFTISSILASADLAPVEAWLLPLAFGPVFVLATKIAVGAWLSSASPDRLPSPTHRLTSWIIGPCLACASLALVGGVALKSVAVGALMPLQDGVSQLSSVLIFAGLALGELAGAAALAARQHRPGARAFGAARDQYRWAVCVHEFAQARLRIADSRTDAVERV